VFYMHLFMHVSWFYLFISIISIALLVFAFGFGSFPSIKLCYGNYENKLEIAALFFC
jgi:hypothetical protein